MENINSFRERLPNIYSKKLRDYKTLYLKQENNLPNKLNFSLNNKNTELINYNKEKEIFNKNDFEKKEKNISFNYFLRLSSINNNKNSNRTTLSKDAYEKNLRKIKMNEILEKLNSTNNNKKVKNISNRVFKDSKNDILFSDSYYNFLNNLKKRRDSIQNKEDKNNEEIKEDNNFENKEESSNDNLKLKFKITNSIRNKKLNLLTVSPNKTLNNIKIKYKTPNKIKLSINTQKNDNLIFHSSNRNNVFGIHNDNYSIYSNNNTTNNLSNKKVCPLCHINIDFYRFRAHVNSHPSRIFNWLYLGSYRNACNFKDLKDLKINYILNCASECEDKNLTSEINYYHAKIDDFPYFQLNPYLDKTNSFINKAKLSGGNILIHCQLGISRSTSCLIAYMIKYLNYSTLSALQFIKKFRPNVMPNFGFLQQLKNYENKIKSKENNFRKENE